MKKRGKNLDLLHEIVEKLANNEMLPEKNKNHSLVNFKIINEKA